MKFLPDYYGSKSLPAIVQLKLYWHTSELTAFILIISLFQFIKRWRALLYHNMAVSYKLKCTCRWSLSTNTIYKNNIKCRCVASCVTGCAQSPLPFVMCAHKCKVFVIKFPSQSGYYMLTGRSYVLLWGDNFIGPWGTLKLRGALAKWEV